MAHCVCGPSRWNFTETLIELKKKANKLKNNNDVVEELLRFCDSCVYIINQLDSKGIIDGKQQNQL